MAIKVCLIPAGGRGSRWAPISGYLPKEMLPLVDRPVIEWVVREVLSSGIKEIVIVINKKKEIIREYLESRGLFKGRVIFHFVYQSQPLGIADTFRISQKYLGDEPFAVALPDLPTISKKSVLAQLIKVYSSKEMDHLVSFGTFPPHTQHLYSECLTSALGNKLLQIDHFCPKSTEPRSLHHSGNRLRMSGRYIFGPSIFKVLKNLKSKEGKEIRDIDALEGALLSGQKVLGIGITGHTYDTGNPESYVRANTAFFKKKLIFSSEG